MTEGQITYREVHDLFERLRGEILGELRLQRAEHIAPLLAWQQQHQAQHEQERERLHQLAEEHDRYHALEKRRAWKATAVVLTLVIAAAGIIAGMIARL